MSACWSAQWLGICALLQELFIASVWPEEVLGLDCNSSGSPSTGKRARGRPRLRSGFRSQDGSHRHKQLCPGACPRVRRNTKRPANADSPPHDPPLQRARIAPEATADDSADTRIRKTSRVLIGAATPILSIAWSQTYPAGAADSVFGSRSARDDIRVAQSRCRSDGANRSRRTLDEILSDRRNAPQFRRGRTFYDCIRDFFAAKGLSRHGRFAELAFGRISRHASNSNECCALPHATSVPCVCRRNPGGGAPAAKVGEIGIKTDELAFLASHSSEPVITACKSARLTSVTYVAGPNCHQCARAGPRTVGGREGIRTPDPLLAKRKNKIYLIGSLGFVLCSSTRFCS